MIKHVGYIRVLKLIIPYFFVVSFFQLLGYVIVGIDLFGGQRAQNDSDFLVIQLFGLTGTTLIIWLFRTKVDNESFKSLGFGKNNLSRDILIGIVAGSVIVLVGFLILIQINEIQYISSEFSFLQLLTGMSLFATVAVAEELLMRGYVLNNFLISFNKYVALFLSSFVFGLLHFMNPDYSFLSFVNLFLAGVFLGLPYLFNKNLWFPFAAHFSWNFVQGTILGFDVSGVNVYSIVDHEYTSATIWNGGGFGWEGSLICTILLTVSIGVLYFIYRRFSN